jgi:hypothetical protein
MYTTELQKTAKIENLEDPKLLDSNQRFEAYLLLAKAHRALARHRIVNAGSVGL